MNRFDKDNVRTLRQDIETALREVAKQHGVTFNVGRITYDAQTFGARLKCVNADNLIDVEKLEWDKNCYKYNFNKADRGKQFDSKGQRYIILGVRPTRRKYPILCRNMQTGKETLFNHHYLHKQIVATNATSLK